MQATNLLEFFDIVLKDVKNMDLSEEPCKANLGITIGNSIGCLYGSRQYVVGLVGTHGSTGIQGPADIPPASKNPEPTYIQGLTLHLSFDATGHHLHRQFIELYGKYRDSVTVDDDYIHILYENSPTTRIRANPKPEFLSQINAVKSKKEEYRAIITKYEDELKKLGIDGSFEIYNFPEDTEPKKEWFDVITEPMNSSIHLCINPKTELWKYLAEHYPGILKFRTYA